MLTLSPHRGQRVEKCGIGSAIVDRLPVASALPGRVFPEIKGPVHRRAGQLVHGKVSRRSHAAVARLHKLVGARISGCGHNRAARLTRAGSHPAGA